MGNVYETIAILAKRSRQISVEMKEELLEKINEFSTVNDSLEDARALIDFCQKTPSKVNLIEYNSVDNTYQKSTLKSTNNFIHILEKHNILVKLRRSRGEDIGAACGQLATQNST